MTKVNIAGMKVKLRILRTRVPKATSPPKTRTGTMFMKRRTAKAAAVASAV